MEAEEAVEAVEAETAMIERGAHAALTCETMTVHFHLLPEHGPALLQRGYEWSWPPGHDHHGLLERCCRVANLPIYDLTDVFSP